jgi:hypothetical protein
MGDLGRFKIYLKEIIAPTAKAVIRSLALLLTGLRSENTTTQ